MASLQLIEVTKRYEPGQPAAVDELSLEIADGELFVLVGPSGCGKSTLLKLVGGLEEPSSGLVYIGDALANYVDPGRRNVAMVFQSYALYPHMTAGQNIRFPLKMRKVPRATADEAVARVAEVLEIEPLLGRPVSALSGGQRQRIAVARALVRRPAVMLMDEPLSNLDALLRGQTREELLRLHRAVPGTIVYVTHDQVEAMTMGDRIGLMHEGRLVQVGSPLDLYQQPASTFVAGFIGSPPMSLIEGRLESRGRDAVFRSEGLAVPLPEALGRAAHEHRSAPASWTLGVRPETVRVRAPNGRPPGPWQVEVIEHLGSERIVGLRCGATRLRSRVGSESELTLDDAVDVSVPQDALHLFDDAGANVLLEGEAAR